MEVEAASNGAAETWRSRITSQRNSGLSIRGWSKQNDCHEHSFYWWRTRLGLSPRAASRAQQRDAFKPSDAIKPLKFAQIVVDHPAAADPVVPEPIRLRLCGGRELLLPAGMPVTQLAQLIRTIEGIA